MQVPPTSNSVFRFDVQDQQDALARPLMEASTKGYADAVRGLIASGMSVHIADGKGNTALHYAATNNRVDVVKVLFLVLLDLGADPLARNQRHDTPMHNAKIVRSSECLALLASSLSQTRPDTPPLLDPIVLKPGSANYHLANAVDCENVAGVFSALSRGANPNLNIQGSSVLSLAVRYACAAIVSLLLQWGANANFVGENLESPLYIAVSNGRQENVAILLKYSASVTSADTFGRNSAHIAALKGHVEILDSLMKSCPVIVESRCANGRTPLHYAALGEQPFCVSLLGSARLDVIDLDGCTPLHLAASHGSHAVVEEFLTLHSMTLQLLTRMCDDDVGDTPFHLASRRKRRDVLTLLQTWFSTQGGSGSISNKAGALPDGVWGVLSKSQAAVEKTQAISVGWALEIPADVVKLQDRMLTLVKMGRVEEVDELLRSTVVDVNGRGSSPLRNSALHLVVSDKSPAMALLLLHRGALINATNEEGITPLHQACMGNNASIFIPVLLRFGADPSLRTRSGLTALMIAVTHLQSEAITFLLQHATLDTVVAVNSLGENVFHLLGKIPGSLGIAKQLLALPVSKVDLNRPSRLFEMPLVIAVRNNQLALAALFAVDYRFDVNAVDRHCASCSGVPVLTLLIQRLQPSDNLSTLETFLSRQNDLLLNALDTKGYTPLHYAYSTSNDAVIALLVSAGANGTIRGLDGKLAAELRGDKKSLGGRLTALFGRRSRVPNEAISSDSPTRGDSSAQVVLPDVPRKAYVEEDLVLRSTTPAGPQKLPSKAGEAGAQSSPLEKLEDVAPSELLSKCSDCSRVCTEEDISKVRLLSETEPRLICHDCIEPYRSLMASPLPSSLTIPPHKLQSKPGEGGGAQSSPLQKLKRSLVSKIRQEAGSSTAAPSVDDTENPALPPSYHPLSPSELLPDLTRLVQITADCRAYVPASRDELPSNVRTWREDIAQIRSRQKETAHVQHSLELDKILKELDAEAAAVEEYVVRPDYASDLLDRMLERRDNLRTRASVLMHQAITSGRALFALQIEEEERILAAGADRREDDANIDAVDAILDRSMSKVDKLQKTRQKTDEMIQELLRQLAWEQHDFDSWRDVSETLTATNRLVDMRRCLTGVRREKQRQEQWVAQSTQHHANLLSIISNRTSAHSVAESLTSATRTLQRRQLELEEAYRFRDLLMKQGQVTEEQELLGAEERVRVAKEKFQALKHEHSALVERANELGRTGFPEVWRGVGHAFRGGALLTIDSFSNIKWIRSPDVRVGEKDGRQWVLKSRVISERRDRSKLEKELFILRRVHHPLIIQLETVFCQGETAFMVFPFYPDGTMQMWLKATSPSRVKLRNAFHGVCQALTYLHSNGIVHADLKLENILMNGDRPILNDFDISRDATYLSATTTLFTNPAGTLTYMAPELFEPNAVSTMESDMWSFGICIFVAFFPDVSPYLAPKAPHVTIPIDSDLDLRTLLELLLDRDPSVRPSADEALVMDFFHERPESPMPQTATREAFREHLHLLKTKTSRGFALRWKINPSDIVSSACALFLSLNSSNCLKSFRITFEGEKGSDSGGLTTSLYRRLFVKMLEPESGIFETRGGGTYLPLPDADCSKMEAIGVALVRAIYDERVVDLPLASTMFKFLFNVPVDMSDLEAFDEQQGSQLKQLQRCPSVQNMELTFAYCGGSDSVLVTDHNKEDFCRAKIRYDLITVRNAQLEAFKKGFWSIAPLQKQLMALTYRDIAVLLCGNSFMNAEMILSVLLYEGFAPSSSTPMHLRSVIEEMTPDDLRLFLYFATEQPAIPFGGLRNPRGHAPVDRITIRCDSLAQSNALPTASVCFYLVKLPQYPTANLLKEKLLLAIRESGTSFDRR